MADSRMPELDEVAHGGLDAGRVVLDDRRERAVEIGAAERHGRQPQCLQQRDPRVLGEDVGQQDTVHPTVGGEPAIASGLRRGVGRDLQDQREVSLGELELDSGDERGEERVRGQQPGGSGDDQPDRVRAPGRKCPGAEVRPPAELVGRAEDALARGWRDAGAAVQREGHRTLAHPGPEGDIGDRRAAVTSRAGLRTRQ